MPDILRSVFSVDFVYSALRLTTPVLFAALGSLVADRAGVINIGLEGIMLFSALTGVLGSAYSGSLFVGMLCGLVTGMFIALIMAYFSLQMKADIVLTGVAMNLVATGGTVFILYSICGDKSVSTSLSSLVFPTLEIPIIKDIPVLGDILSGHNLLTYLSLVAVIAVWFFLEKSKPGLRIRAVGENDHAAGSVGIHVRRVRYGALLLSGALASFGGMFLSMGMLTYFSKNMTAGRGYIALAAQALGNGSAVGTFFASLVFGCAEALSVSLQGVGLPPQFVQMVPYVATVLGLVLYAALRKRSKKTVRKHKRRKRGSQ